MYLVIPQMAHVLKARTPAELSISRREEMSYETYILQRKYLVREALG